MIREEGDPECQTLYLIYLCILFIIRFLQHLVQRGRVIFCGAAPGLGRMIQVGVLVGFGVRDSALPTRRL